MLQTRGGKMLMPSVRVVTDSTADIPPQLAAELGITVIPANVQFGMETFRDGVDLTRDELYDRLVNGPIMPTTAAPASGVFAATYRRLVHEAAAAGEPLEGIVSVHVASNLSAMCNAARLGAEEVTETDVRLVDSQQVSIGTGWLAILAARAALRGQSLAQVVSLAQERVPRLRLIALLDTLEYVRRSGRLGRARWLIGSLLSIKPLLEVRHGEVLPPVELVRTRSRGLERLVELARSVAPFEEMAVMHAHAPELGKTLLERVGFLHPPERTLFAEVGVTIGTYAGPGTVGIVGIRAA